MSFDASTGRSPAQRSLSKKGLKLLGVSARALINKILDGATQGGLDRDELFLFWRDLSGNDSAADSTEYLQLCVASMQEAIDGRRVLGFPWHALVNTISFIALRLPIRKNAPSLRATLQDIKTSRLDRGVFSAADEVLRTVHKRLVENELALDTLLIQMSTLYSAQELTVLTDYLHFPSLDGSKVVGGELGFVYFYVRYGCCPETWFPAVRPDATCL